MSIDTLHLDPRLVLAELASVTFPRASAHLPHEPQPPRGPGGHETRVFMPPDGALMAGSRAHARGERVGAQRERERSSRTRQESGVGWRSRAPVVFYLQASPAAPIAGRPPAHPDELSRRSGAPAALVPCAPMGGITIRRCIWACQRPLPASTGRRKSQY